MKKKFYLFPAIDLRSGQVVRLKEGDPERQTTYSSHPAEMAQNWINAGAAWLHVINLDGAFGIENTPNLKTLASIVETATGMETKIQFGGGLRSMEDIAAVMDMGVARAVLGTAVIKDPQLLEQALRLWGEDRIAVSLDARGEEVQTHGWQQNSHLDLFELAEQYKAMGLEWVVYTDIARDGLQTGYNMENTHKLAQRTQLQVIASGGVRSMEDIAMAQEHNLGGIIIGKALYEGVIDLEQAIIDYQIL